MGFHDKFKEKRAGRSRGFGWKPKEGDQNQVFILPAYSSYLNNWDAMDTLALEFKQHWIGVEGQPKEVTRCLKELKKTCPACVVSWQHRKSDDPALQEMAKDIRVSDGYLFNMLDLNNLAGGIQPWASNYTCWDQIMEIAADAQWGVVCDPVNGLPFKVNLTGGKNSRTGRNQYRCTPSPNRLNVSPVLEAIPGWQGKLDELEDLIVDAKTEEEIRGLLDDMGFPNVGGSKTVVAAPSPAPVPASVPAPGALPPQPITPPPPQQAAGGPVPVSAPAGAAPVSVPVSPQMVQAPIAGNPASVHTALPPTQAPPTTAPPVQQAVHYDPGPQYQAKVPDHERPVGAPRCFGDYNPDVHQCHKCPVYAPCQMRTLGVQA